MFISEKFKFTNAGNFVNSLFVFFIVIALSIIVKYSYVTDGL